MIRRLTILASSSLLLLACGKKSEQSSPAAAPAAGAPLTAPTGPASKLEPLPFEAGKLPPGVAVAGTIVAGLHWRDVDGEAYLVLSSEREEGADAETVKLHARLVAVDAAGATSVRWTQDATVEDCEFDAIAAFRDEAMSLTDLDDDGRGEVTLAYETACTSDMSPFELVLFVVEGSQAHRMKGRTAVDAAGLEYAGGEVIGGEMTADASFDAAPALRAHADATWNKIVGP